MVAPALLEAQGVLLCGPTTSDWMDVVQMALPSCGLDLLRGARGTDGLRDRG